MCQLVPALGIARHPAYRVIVRPPARPSPGCARRADEGFEGTRCRWQGLATRLPGNPAWRSDQMIVLRPREYHRVTPAGEIIADQAGLSRARVSARPLPQRPKRSRIPNEVVAMTAPTENIWSSREPGSSVSWMTEGRGTPHVLAPCSGILEPEFPGSPSCILDSDGPTISQGAAQSRGGR